MSLKISLSIFLTALFLFGSYPLLAWQTCAEFTTLPSNENSIVLEKAHRTSGSLLFKEQFSLNTPPDLLISAVADSVAERRPRTTPLDSSVEKKADTAKPAPTSTMTKSPTGAIWRSLVCPGWGQFYNESYIKAGLFFGGAVTCVSVIVWNNSKFSDATSRYNSLSDTNRLKESTYREKEFYRDQRDVAGLWLIGVYLIAAVDAYVGAHLYDFDVSDKGVTALPQASPSSVGFRLSYRW